MNIKRISSSIVGFPLVMIILIFGNKYIIDLCFTFVAMISINEYFSAISKKAKPVKWLGILSCLSISLVHIIPEQFLMLSGMIAIPLLLLLLFVQVIATDMKTSFKDIAYTFIGIVYIVVFLMYLALIGGMENGKLLIWYTLIAAWVTDIFAYVVGVRIGKHKFSSVSPKKSIEGSIAGMLGAVLVAVIYTFVINKFCLVNYSYITTGILALILSVIGQIGDFAASTIKRYVDIKDYSDLIPGHGGMLDRIDSLMFIAPFAYVLLNLFLQMNLI